MNKTKLSFTLILFIVKITAQTISFHNNIKKFDPNDFDIRIVELETKNNFLIGQPNQVVYRDDKWFISDRLTNQIFIFNKDGSFYSKINEQGNAPGKYSNIRYFSINPYNSQIEIFDNFQNSIYIYDYSGNFIKKIRLSFFMLSFEYLNKNTIVINKQYQKDETKYNYNLLFTDNKFKIIKKFDRITQTPSSAASFVARLPLKKINNKIYWIKTYNPNLYVIDDLNSIKTIKLDFGSIWPEKSFAFNSNLHDRNLIFNTFKAKYIQYFDIFPFNNQYMAKYYYKDVPYISVYDKNTNSNITYDCSNMPDKLNDFIGYTDNYVITMINPLDLLDSNIPLTKHQKNLINNYEDEPNPWIVLLRKK